MTFDAAGYKRDVLAPWSKEASRREALQAAVSGLQSDSEHQGFLGLDLTTLFAMPAGSSSRADLAAHGRQLEMAFNKAKVLPAATHLKKLKALLTEQGRFEDPGFWAGLGSHQAEARRTGLTRAMSDLASEAPLGVMGAGEASRRLAALGVPDVDAKAIAEQAKAAGLRVFDEFRPPDGSALRTLSATWRRVRVHPDYRTIVDVMCLGRAGQPSDIRLVDTLSADGTAIGPADVEAAHRRSTTLKDTEAVQDAQKFLAELRKIPDSTRLRDVALEAVMERVEELRGQGVPQTRLGQTLLDAGIDDFDARRIVVTVVGAGQPQVASVGTDEVRVRLADGDLSGARRVLEALRQDDDTASERAALAEQIGRLEARKAAALEAYRAAAAAADFESAARHLGEARSLDRDDAALSELAARLPLPAPSVAARSAASGVELTWTESDPGARYTVYRLVGEVMGSSPSGTVVARDTVERILTDHQAPVGEPLCYGVVALRRDGGTLSSPGTVGVTHLPPLSGVEARPGPGFVDLSWADEPRVSAVSVEVVGPDGGGRRSEVQGALAVRIPDLEVGRPYRFVLIARYLTNAGVSEAPPVSVTATPRGSAQAVTDLTVEPGGADDTCLVSWTPVPGFSTELWLMPRQTDLVVGQAMSAERLRGLGGRNLGVRSALRPDGRVEGSVAMPPEVGLLVPLVSTGTDHLVGAPLQMGRAPSPRHPVAKDMRDQVRLTWEWPEGDYLVEVSWTTSLGPRSRRVTRARYLADGAVYLADPADVGDIRLQTVTRTGEEEWVSGPVLVSRDSPSTQPFTYTLATRRGLLGKTSVTIDVRAPGQAGPALFDLFLGHGSTMPASAHGMDHVQELALDFSEAPQRSVTVELGRVKSPYWLKLFARDPRTTPLIDPPTSQLKG